MTQVLCFYLLLEFSSQPNKKVKFDILDSNNHFIFLSSPLYKRKLSNTHYSIQNIQNSIVMLTNLNHKNYVLQLIDNHECY